MDYKLIDRILALSNLMGQADLAYIEADLNLQVSSWNPGAEKLFGYTENETMGRFLNELIPVSKRELNKRQQMKLLALDAVNGQDVKIQCEIHFISIMNTRFFMTKKKPMNLCLV